MNQPIVRAVLRGPVKSLGATTSAIDKRPVEGGVTIGALGVIGDAQADLRVHGGTDKAVHCYPWQHYDAWRQELPRQPLLESPGAFGENLSLDGMDESSVCIADHWRIGTAEFVVTQGRQPCFKLNLRFGHREMARRVQDTLRAGWYLRVTKEGVVRAGDAVELLARPHPDHSVATLLRVIRDRHTDADVLAGILQLPLPPSWRQLFERRLQSQRIESWERRLSGD